MNIVIVTDFAYVNGGSGRVALQTARRLALSSQFGVDQVHIVAATGPVEESLLGIPQLDVTVVGVDPYLEVSGPGSVLQGLWNEKSERTLAETLAKMDPADTVVHVHSFKDAHTGSVVRVANKLGFRILYTAHDYSAVCPHVGLFHVAQGRVCPHMPMSLKCVCSNCQGTNLVRKQFNVAKFLVQQVRGKVPKGFDRILAVSQLSHDLLRRSVPYSVPIQVLPPPVEIEKGDRVRAEKNRTFAFVGRISPEKDPVSAALAAKEVGVPIKFVGDGPLAEAVKKANPDAEITGWQTPEGVRDHLRQARAVMLPSLWHETFGLTVAEGVAMGVPAIVSNVCAAAEFVEDRHAGIVHEAGNRAQMVQAINAMLDDATCLKMSEQGYREYWAAPLTMDRHLVGLVRQYRDVLGFPPMDVEIPSASGQPPKVAKARPKATRIR